MCGGSFVSLGGFENLLMKGKVPCPRIVDLKPRTKSIQTITTLEFVYSRLRKGTTKSLTLNHF